MPPSRGRGNLTSDGERAAGGGHNELRGNPARGPWVVQKYGGTSVGKFIENLAEQIVPTYLDRGDRVVLVCSARSGDTKATGTTNLLLQASTEALDASASAAAASANGRYTSPPSTPTSVQPNPLTTLKAIHRTASQAVVNGVSAPPTRSNSPGPPSSSLLRNSFTPLSSSISSLRSLEDAPLPAFHATVDQIRDDHIAAARKCIHRPDILRSLEEEIEYDCERLRSFLTAAQIIDEISPRSKDVIIGVGERLSCRIVAALLRDRGIDSELVLLDTIVEKAEDDRVKGDGKGGDDGALSQSFYDNLARRLGERLRECEDRVPVVTGFFGVVPGSLLNQIGRGYTDLCAALCAVGLKASELQIWKEVDGIFTADPRKVPTARLLPRITPEEAAELTYYGSEVIHPFTMEQVIRAAIPIRMKNVEAPEGTGTVIYPDDANATSDVEPLPSPTTATHPQLGKLPTAVTIKDRILVLNVRSNRKTISHGFFAKIFTVLDRHGIVVDLIATSEVHVSMAMHGVFRKGLLDRVIGDLKALGEVSYKQDMAILSLVGKQMHNMVGIAGRMFTVLAEGSINIEVISQGSSEINVSCVINGKDAVKALNLVHLKLLTLSAPSPVMQQNGSARWY